jgi:hypothetical protein
LVALQLQNFPAQPVSARISAIELSESLRAKNCWHAGQSLHAGASYFHAGQSLHACPRHAPCARKLPIIKLLFLSHGLLTAVARRFAAASAVPRARGEHVTRLLALTALPVKSGLSTHRQQFLDFSMRVQLYWACTRRQPLRYRCGTWRMQHSARESAESTSTREREPAQLYRTSESALRSVMHTGHLCLS